MLSKNHLTTLVPDNLSVTRRSFLGGSLALSLGVSATSETIESPLTVANKILSQAAHSGEVQSSALYAQRGDEIFSLSYGKAADTDAIFLLASISKTIAIAAVMTLFDEGQFKLDDPVQRYIPEFTGDGRDKITVRHLMTHVSGLPDQLPENSRLRSSHAPLSQFVSAAIKTPLLFEPGTRYGYSSMAILLATEIARRIDGRSIAELTEQRIYKPLQMNHSAMGLGSFGLSDVVMNQVERAAPESGAGDPTTKSWDWNSPYWRKMGAPWGAAHGSVKDVAEFLHEFMHSKGRILQEETIKMMIRNHNPPGLRRRGLGFDLGQIGKTPNLSDQTFGHTGSTGTICWADPSTDSICVILTTLPYRAVSPHPRDLVAKQAAKALCCGAVN